MESRLTSSYITYDSETELDAMRFHGEVKAVAEADPHAIENPEKATAVLKAGRAEKCPMAAIQ